MSTKISCESVSAAIIPYLDGRASAAERQTVESHAAECPSCRTRIAEFRAVSSVLDEVPSMAPSPSFDARVRERIAAQPRSRRFEWFAPTPRLAFSLAVLLALSVWFGRLSTEPNPANAAIQSEQDYRTIKDLRVLENYDVLKDFDALSELPIAPPQQAPDTPSRPQDSPQNINDD